MHHFSVIVMNFQLNPKHTTRRKFRMALVLVTSREMEQSSGNRRDPPPTLAPIPAKNVRPAFCKIVKLCARNIITVKTNAIHKKDTCNASNIERQVPMSDAFSLSHSTCVCVNMEISTNYFINKLLVACLETVQHSLIKCRHQWLHLHNP